MICVSFVSVICVMVNKLILMNSIEWTPCVSAVSCKYLLQYEGKLIFANPLIHDWLWISRTSLCEAVCLRSEVRYRADATAIVVLSWAMLAEGIGSIFIGDNMEPDRLALWMQVCHFGYYSYIYPLIRQKHPKTTCRILKCSSTYPSINPLDTTNHSQTNLYPAMQREANMAAVPSLSSVISIGNG